MAYRKLGWIGAAAVSLVIGFGGAAQASSVFMSAWNQVPAGIAVTVAGGPPAGGNGTFGSGQFQITLNPGATLNTATSSLFDAWCVDIFQNISAPMVYTAVPFDFANVGADPSNPPGTFTAAQITQVSGLAILGNLAIDGNNANNGSFNALLGGYNDQVVSAAIQATIWRVLHPLKTITSSDVSTQALMNVLWTNINSFTGSGGMLLRSGTGQDQLVFPGPGGGGFQVVPTPAAALVFLFGLAGLAAVRRRA